MRVTLSQIYTPRYVNTSPQVDTPYDGQWGEAPPLRGTVFRLQGYEREGVSQVEIYERVGKPFI